MLLEADCVPCILRMSVAALRQLQLDDNAIREITADILETPALRGLDWNTTSAEVIEDVWYKIVENIGTPDPFRSAKSNQNKRILDLYPVLQQLVSASSDPLYTAVKLAIWGNSIDLMVADASADFDIFSYLITNSKDFKKSTLQCTVMVF